MLTNLFQKFNNSSKNKSNQANSGKTNTVTLINPQGEKRSIEVFENEYISEAAVRQQVDLPVSCNNGMCVTCTAKLLEGSITHDHSFLKLKEEEAGFLLTCHTLAKSDCVILTHQEEALLDL